MATMTVRQTAADLDGKLPAPTTAKAILAALSGNELEQWLAATKLTSLTVNTRSTRAALLNAQQRIRQPGYAEDCGKGIERIRWVAALILDIYQRPVDARGVMSATKRLPQKRFPEISRWCIDAAKRVRKELLS